MPFAARKHDDGTWRLCKRMGDTILRAVFSNDEIAIGPFSSQAKTKDCADELNTRWKEYDRAVSRDELPNELADWMMRVIASYGGCTLPK